MKITCLRKTKYSGTIIYIMQFHNTFQYLFADQFGEIYQQTVELKPNPLRYILYKLKLVKDQYTKDDLEAGEKIVLTGAIDSIDKLSEKRKMKHIGKEARKRVKAGKMKNECVWRAITLNGESYYECLLHGATVKMVEGRQPYHTVANPGNPSQKKVADGKKQEATNNL